MKRNWKMMAWTGKRYEETNCGDSRFEANGAQDAIKKAGLEDPMYEVVTSRVGYGHFTGRVEVRAPETVAAAEGKRYPLPADFLLLVVD